MDAISEKKVDILRAFASLVDSGADVSPYIASAYWRRWLGGGGGGGDGGCGVGGGGRGGCRR